MKKQFYLVVLMIAISGTFFAQEEKKSSFSFHFGPTFPMADFGDDDPDEEDALGAAVGIGLGLQYTYPLSETGLGLFVSLDVNHNWLKNDVKDDIVEIFEDYTDEIDEDDITFNKFFNIPVSVGLSYAIEADEKLSFYGNVGLAVNFFKITNLTVEYQGEEITSEYDLSSAIGAKIGGGVIINGKTYISINYFGLGKHEIDVNTELSGDNGYDEDYDFKTKVNYLTLTVGFKL